MHHSRKHAERKQHAATTKVAQQVQRWHGSLGGSDTGKRARKSDIVDVMASARCKSAGLTPSRHAPVCQARITLKANVRAQPKPFHHTRPKPFDHAIGSPDQVKHKVTSFCPLQINCDGSTTARQNICLGIDCPHSPARAQRMHADHLAPVIGEHHGCKRRGPEAGKLDNAQSFEHTGHGYSPREMTRR